MNDYPKLRGVEAIPIRDNQICLRDPMGFSEKMLLLNPATLFICSLFDGRNSIVDVQAQYTRRFGDLLFNDNPTSPKIGEKKIIYRVLSRFCC